MLILFYISQVVNRTSDEEAEFGNHTIDERLVSSCHTAVTSLYIVHANPTRATRDIHYGRGKKREDKFFFEFDVRFADLVLPHIFRESVRAHCINVTATLMEQLRAGETHEINPDGVVQLIHVGGVPQAAIDAANEKLAPEGVDVGCLIMAGLDRDIILASVDAVILTFVERVKARIQISIPVHYCIASTSETVVSLVLGTASLSNQRGGIRQYD